MSTPGWYLNTLGKTYEVRGNGADGRHWRDKPLYGWSRICPRIGLLREHPEQRTCMRAASMPIS